MSKSLNTEDELRARITELEGEVGERQADLKRFREELVLANGRLEALIGLLDNELKLAHVIQKVLVPTEFPHIAGFEFSTKFRPSMVTGGDYFDIFEHQDRFRFGVIISSASGHAMSALLLNVLLKMTGQMESRRGSDPHQVLEDIHEQLREHLEPADSADLFYALIDRRNFEMKYARAGEIVALYQNAATEEVRVLDSPLPPLAKEWSSPAESSSLSLNPRDRLLLCTRGVIEARNDRGETFGLEGVTRSFLSGPKRGVHELRNHVLFEAESFVAKKELLRDQTIVAIEVKDKVIKLAKA